MKEGTTFNFWEQENNKKKLYIKKKWSNFLKEPDSKKKKKFRLGAHTVSVPTTQLSHCSRNTATENT